jgi:multidrug resistance efflux pump
VELDPRDFEVAVASAEADLQSAGAAKANLEEQLKEQAQVIAAARASIQGDRATLEFAQRELDRYGFLAKTASGTDERWQQAQSDFGERQAALQHDTAIDIGGGRECATNAKSVQSSMRHFARAVERLQKLDSKRMGDDPAIHRVTQDLASDLRGMWSARDSAKDNVQGSKDLPLLLHGKGFKGKLRRQESSRRSR